MKAVLTRLNVCPCGYPLLKDDIRLGTVYEADPSRLAPNGALRCGGCGELTAGLKGIWVRRANEPGGFLPMRVFCFEWPCASCKTINSELEPPIVLKCFNCGVISPAVSQGEKGAV